MKMSPIAPSDELLAFARTLRQLRRERDLSQEALASRANLHPKHISDIERATKEPRLFTIVRLARALDMAPDELIAAMDSRLAETDRSAATR